MYTGKPRRRPPNTTHILQPLSVSIILWLLKAIFSSIATQPGHMNKHQIVKAKSLSVLSYIIDEIYSLARVKGAFTKTGLALFNSYAIDKSAARNTSTVPEPGPFPYSANNTFLCMWGLLFTEGEVSHSRTTIFHLCTCFCEPMTARRKLVTKTRVINSY